MRKRPRAPKRAPASDLDPVIEAYKKDVDRTLLRKNLSLSVDERFLQLMELQRFAEELRRAGKAAELQALREERDRADRKPRR